MQPPSLISIGSGTNWSNRVAQFGLESLSESLIDGEVIAYARTLLTKGQGLINSYAYSPQTHPLLGQISTEAFSDYRHANVRLHGGVGARGWKASQSYPFRR